MSCLSLNPLFLKSTETFNCTFLQLAICDSRNFGSNATMSYMVSFSDAAFLKKSASLSRSTVMLNNQDLNNKKT